MRSRRDRGSWIPLVVCAATVGGLAWAEPQIPGELRRALSQRAGTRALEGAQAVLAAHPDSLDAQAWLGAAYAVANRPVEAVDAFELAQGSAWYLDNGVRHHADSLRTIGRGREAAELRLSGRVEVEPGGHTAVSLEINVLEDYLAAGELELALEQAEVVEGILTRPARGHAVIADLHRLLGDEDEMLWHLFLGSRNGNHHYRATMVELDLALADGRVEDAWDASEAIRKQHIRLPSFWGQKAILLELVGSPAMCLARLNGRRFREHIHPDLLLAETRCHLAMGDLPEATRAAELLALHFPELSQTEQAWQALEAGPWVDGVSSDPR